MKIKCESCGKKEAEIMSKLEIKNTSNFVGIDLSLVNKIIDLADNLFAPNYIVCKSCGHVKKS